MIYVIKKTLTFVNYFLSGKLYGYFLRGRSIETETSHLKALYSAKFALKYADVSWKKQLLIVRKMERTRHWI